MKNLYKNRFTTSQRTLLSGGLHLVFARHTVTVTNSLYHKSKTLNVRPHVQTGLSVLPNKQLSLILFSSSPSLSFCPLREFRNLSVLAPVTSVNEARVCAKNISGNTDLNPYVITGFSDGEACFYVGISRTKWG